MLQRPRTVFLVALSFACAFLLSHSFRPVRTKSARNKTDTTGWPQSFGFGKSATAKQIRAVDISIRPDGKGLPPGSGTASIGRLIYKQKCLSCHGTTGKEGPYSVLVGSMGDTIKTKTIGNYWPYSTTIFDFVRRAMPFNAPGSLTDNEVYSLTAFLLHENHIIDSNQVINAASLPGILMPAKKLFVADDRSGGAEIK